MTLERAYELRRVVETAATSLDDSTAIIAPELFPYWKPNTEYIINDRVRERSNGLLYKCLQAHTSQLDWYPSGSPSLWAKVLIPDENIIPEWEQPDSTNAYMIGDKVSYNGKIYESVIDNNVWSPEAYPAGWKEV